jgi:hypothetical protein
MLTLTIPVAVSFIVVCDVMIASPTMTTPKKNKLKHR